MKIVPVAIIGLLVLCSTNALIYSVAPCHGNGQFKSVSKAANRSNMAIKEVSFSLSTPSIKQDGHYTTVHLEEATSKLSKTGKPSLPTVTKVLTFPLGTQIKNIDVSFSKNESYTLCKKIKPTGYPLSPSTEYEQKLSLTPEQSYDISLYYPPNRYEEHRGGGLYEDKHVTYLSITCHPIRYLAVANALELSRHVDITVTYCPPQKISFDADEQDMVVIAPQTFLQKVQPLIDHKNAVGIRTILVTCEEIYDIYEGRDQAEQIKYFIKNAIESWGISYVLLIGDISKIPMRVTAVHVDIWSIEDVPTDLYYADIFNASGDFDSWDSNQDDIFSECYADVQNTDFICVDMVDLYPDVGVGRIYCKNNIEVETAVQKIITYETQTYNQEWFNRIILMGGDTFPGMGNVYEGEVVTEKVYQAMQEFEATKLWTSTTSFHPFLINEAISNGAGFVSYSGHGFERGIGTYPPDDDDIIKYRTLHVLRMKNGNKLPIMYFDACLTATPDMYMMGAPLSPFAWSVVKNIWGGAIAAIGSTRVAYIIVDNEGIHLGSAVLHTKFFEFCTPGKSISDVFNKAKTTYLNSCFKDYLTLQEFTLVGDPSLKIGGYP